MSPVHFPFIAGLIAGAILGACATLVPRSVRWAGLAGGAFLLYLGAFGGVAAVEESMISHVTEFSAHGRFMFGVGLALVMTLGREQRTVVGPAT